MKYDSIIIGGGLAGLTCAIRCQQAGMKTALITQGQSALHFSSGSIDVLSQLPDGTKVSDPFEGIQLLVKNDCHHPYSHLGSEKVQMSLSWFTSMMKEQGVPLLGGDNNHLRLTAMGTLRPTWLSQPSVTQWNEQGEQPYSKVALVAIEGFRDFQPKIAADNLGRHPLMKGVRISTASIAISDITKWQKRHCEMRSIDIARQMKDELVLQRFARLLLQKAGDAELVVLPSAFGNGDGLATLRLLEGLTGYKICEVATMPPSLMGIRIEESLRNAFQQFGGTLLAGDEVLWGEFDHNHLTRIYTRHHEDFPLTANHYFLGTGSFFSKGLVATKDMISEPVFNLDIDAKADREEWLQKAFVTGSGQPFMRFGVKTNNKLNPWRNGTPVENLYCGGALMSGYDPIADGCGGGVAISTGFSAAENMIEHYRQKEPSQQQDSAQVLQGEPA
ncbi:glycerol-3-phosphate dehydrogenase subunit GlpB [Parasalinivibrio latis]|uniref:glycerol-3-phosphate dehydrogenase subunit GlpB n=1 Tax=Parasalinivibrio latis TaxID=2952610 RepID=UPI0030E41E60